MHSMCCLCVFVRSSTLFYPFQWKEKKFRWLHNDASVYSTESVAIEWKFFAQQNEHSENIHWCQTTQMRVLLLYCFWSHAHCVEVVFCSRLTLSSTSSRFYFILDDFPIYFAIWSLWVYQCVSVYMPTKTTTTDDDDYDNDSNVFIHQMPVVVVRFTFNVFTNVNAINSSCVWIAGTRSSGREAMLVIAQSATIWMQKQKVKETERKGRKRSRTHTQKSIRTHDENKKMYFIILYGYRLCT